MNDQTDVSLGGTTAHVWVDVSDLLVYLEVHRSVSGVQRVVVETIRQLVRDQRSFSLCSFASHNQRFVVVDPGEFFAMLDDLKNQSDEDSSTDSRKAAKALSKSLTSRAHVRVSHGDVLAVLGASWTTPGIFGGIQELKRAGAKVLTLIYDLIPVIDTAFPDQVSSLFRDYLMGTALLSDRVCFISEATRRDFVEWAERNESHPALGAATGLPPGMTPDSYEADEVGSAPLWPRPYVLMVGAIEERKNHIAALRAWQRLCDRLGPENVPDLICAGRLGWGVEPFLRELSESPLLSEKIRLPKRQVGDADLYRLYRDCEFTVFPSKFEGWGLPVAESIAFGKAVVSSNTSSLPEAGGQAAIYVDPDDHEALSAAVERLLLDDEYREQVQKVASEQRQLTWAAVVESLLTEFAATADQDATARAEPTLTAGIEYPLYELAPYRGGISAQTFSRHLRITRRLALTGQSTTPEGSVIGLLAMTADPIPSAPVVDPKAIPPEPSPANPAGWNRGKILGPSHTAQIRFNLEDEGTHGLLLSTKFIASEYRLELRVGSTTSVVSAHHGSPILVEFESPSRTGPVEISIRNLGGADAAKPVEFRSIVVVQINKDGSVPAPSSLVQILNNATNVALEAERARRGYVRRIAKLERIKSGGDLKLTYRMKRKARHLATRGSTTHAALAPLPRAGLFGEAGTVSAGLGALNQRQALEDLGERTLATSKSLAENHTLWKREAALVQKRAQRKI